jgi:hypothetical protein
MLLVLEIMLTMTAWRKGYKVFALIPVGLALLAGFSIGANNPDADVLSVIWVDILAIIVLVGMIAVAKSPVDEEARKTQESSVNFSEQNEQKKLASCQPEAELN